MRRTWQVSRSIFQSHDVGVRPCEANRRFTRNFSTSSSRNVVEHHGKRRRVRNRAQVSGNADLRRSRVGRRGGKNARGAGGGYLFREGHRVGRVRRTRTSENRNVNGLCNARKKIQLLFIRERVTLARRTRNDNAFAAVLA